MNNTCHLYCQDNLTLEHNFLTSSAQIVFSDYVYENKNFGWISQWWSALKENGLFISMTDYHTLFELGTYLQNMPNATFVNHLVWKNEWGNHPKNRFHQCFDNIVIFCNGTNWKFDSSKIQVPKATVNTKLNPSGRQTKTATAFIDDICLTTTSKERVKRDDGHLVRWQKPLKLYNRIIAPFVSENDLILDLFMGTGSLGKWCILHNIDYVGVENNPEIYDLAVKNLYIENEE
jgi:DNA modification methylase